MKKSKLTILATIYLFAHGLNAQELSLLDCYDKAERNSPLISQIQKLGEIGAASAENAVISWKPRLTLTGRVSWQSDVTSLDLTIPGTGFQSPEISKDWYKAYLDISQTIYDGGLSKASREFELIKTAHQQQQVRVSMFELRSRVNGAFFSWLSLKNQLDIAGLRKKTLDKQYERLRSAVKNGTVHESELLLLEAERIKAESMITEISNGLKTSLSLLSFLIGEDEAQVTSLKAPLDPALKNIALKNSRPELQLFEKQSEQLSLQSQMAQKMRSPKVFGFGQVGYGRPGLNMLDDEFADWYVFGVGVNWKVFDWDETKRKRKILDLQQDIVSSNADNFLFQLELAQKSKWSDIMTATQLIENDLKVQALYEKIAQASSSRLANGVITSSEYVLDLNASVEAELKLKQRETDILKLKYEYLTLIGFEYENIK